MACPAVQPEETFSLLRIPKIKSCLLARSGQGVCRVVTQLSIKLLPRAGLGWISWHGTAGSVSPGPPCTQGQRVNVRCWRLELIVLTDACPYLGQWPHYPRVRGKVSMGFCLCHSLLLLSPLCRKSDFAEALKLYKQPGTWFPCAAPPHPHLPAESPTHFGDLLPGATVKYVIQTLTPLHLGRGDANQAF